jgi:hypothetical protein
MSEQSVAEINKNEIRPSNPVLSNLDDQLGWYSKEIHKANYSDLHLFVGFLFALL